MACRISVPQPEIERGPQQWKGRVLTTGPPGNSLIITFYMWPIETKSNLAIGWFFPSKKRQDTNLGLGDIDVLFCFVLFVKLPLQILIHLQVLCINYAFGMVTGVCCNLTVTLGYWEGIELNCQPQPQHQAVFEPRGRRTYGISAFTSRKAAQKL